MVTTDNTDQVELSFAYSPQGVTLNCNGTGTDGDIQTVSSGVASFSCSSVNATNDQLAATSPNNSSLADAISSPVKVNPGPPAAMSFTTEPSNAASGAVFPVVVSLSDAYGNPETNDNTDQVTLALTPGTGTAGATLSCTPSGATSLSDTSTVSSGVAGFTCSLTNAGLGYTLTATNSAGTLPTATSSSFNVGQESATFVPPHPRGHHQQRRSDVHRAGDRRGRPR